MKVFQNRRRNPARGLPILIPLLLVLAMAVQVRAEKTKSTSVDALAGTDVLHLGERMYREGILPSGEPMEATVKGDIPVTGIAFACEGCHLRSGLGSFEGRVYTPAANGGSLFRPLDRFYNDVRVTSEPPLRPAYTDKTLADAIRAGIDPTGRKLNDVMPRYMLGDKDMAILVSYLKSLSREFSPGATHTTLHFATVIAGGVSPEDREAILAALKNYIAIKNSQAGSYRGRRRNSRMEGWWAVKYLKLSLSEWQLKGPPDTWRSQLEENYRNDPVFALIGGISKGEWKPIHDFSEANHIPCLFPATDLPVISETDWYTMYFSKGLYQEGEAAARYLNNIAEGLKDKGIVEVVSDSPESRALSRGFRETWRGLGHKPAATAVLKEDQLKAGSLKQLSANERPPGVVIFWGGPETLPSLEKLVSGAGRPGMVFVSAGYLGGKLRSLGNELRGITYITYPFGLSTDITGYRFDIPFAGRNVRGGTEETLKRTYSLLNVLTRALIEMRGNYYRDYFFDVIGMMEDQRDPLYERLSFGQGQRYASKGCFIVQLGEGPEPKLLKKSGWVIP